MEPRIRKMILMKRSPFLALPSPMLTRTTLTHLWSSTTVDHTCLIARKSHTTFWLSMQWSPGYICNSISHVLRAMHYLPFLCISLHFLIWISHCPSSRFTPPCIPSVSTPESNGLWFVQNAETYSLPPGLNMPKTPVQIAKSPFFCWIIQVKAVCVPWSIPSSSIHISHSQLKLSLSSRFPASKCFLMIGARSHRS